MHRSKDLMWRTTEEIFWEVGSERGYNLTEGVCCSEQTLHISRWRRWTSLVRLSAEPKAWRVVPFLPTPLRPWPCCHAAHQPPPGTECSVTQSNSSRLRHARVNGLVAPRHIDPAHAFSFSSFFFFPFPKRWLLRTC
jgi:hypothetical protein